MPEIMKPTFGDGPTLPYLGKNYPLRINKDKTSNTLSFVDREFTVDITSPKIDGAARLQIRHLYEEL
jgi:hypothetical protein